VDGSSGRQTQIVPRHSLFRLSACWPLAPRSRAKNGLGYSTVSDYDERVWSLHKQQRLSQQCQSHTLEGRYSSLAVPHRSNEFILE
jgi:hypothetical protein